MGRRCDRVDLERRTLRAQTKTGAPLDLPVTKQLVALPERPLEANAGHADVRQWSFPSTVPSGRGAGSTSTPDELPEIGNGILGLFDFGGAIHYKYA